MKRNHRVLSALFLMSSLSLIACGDDIVGPVGSPQIPRDEAKAKASDQKSVALGSDGSLADEVAVGAKLRSDAKESYALLTLEKGTKLYDISEAPISSGQLDVGLDSYNSNLDQGLNLFAQERVKARAQATRSDTLGFSDIHNKVGAVQIRLEVEGKVVNQSKSPSGEGSGLSLRYCSPSLSVFRAVSVAQAESASSYDVFNSNLAVAKDGGHHCVNFDLPNTLHATATLSAGFIISGSKNAVASRQK